VTESGDTIFLKDADASAFPLPSMPGLFGASYIDGVEIKGGTGRFMGATGTLQVFGAVNLTLGQVILRYQGNIFFAEQQQPSGGTEELRPNTFAQLPL
jgi:hypothetical protein